jgi:hypothetical protein
VSEPERLSRTLVAAFNAQDADAIERMVAPRTDYLRAGAAALATPGEVRAQYLRDFETMPGARAAVTRVVATTATDIAFEVAVTVGGTTVEGAVHHRWEGGLLTRYRSWMSPPPR